MIVNMHQPEIPNRVVAYTRVSTEEQAASGLGLQGQSAAIKAEAERRGWVIEGWYEDAGISAKTLDRPGLCAALTSIEKGEAGAIVVAKLDRLSRSLMDFGALLERSKGKGWGIVALDLAVDTTTPAGALMANTLIMFSQYEREIISQRTKTALAAKKAQGIALGRPRTIPASVLERITKQRKAGISYAKIAAALNADGIAVAQHGKKWWGATVRDAHLGTRRG